MQRHIISIYVDDREEGRIVCLNPVIEYFLKFCFAHLAVMVDDDIENHVGMGGTCHKPQIMEAQHAGQTGNGIPDQR